MEPVHDATSSNETELAISNLQAILDSGDVTADQQYAVYGKSR